MFMCLNINSGGKVKQSEKTTFLLGWDKNLTDFFAESLINVSYGIILYHMVLFSIVFC